MHDFFSDRAMETLREVTNWKTCFFQTLNNKGNFYGDENSDANNTVKAGGWNYTRRNDHEIKSVLWCKKFSSMGRIR